MQKVHRPVAKAQSGLADKVFIYGCTAVYLMMVAAVVTALKLHGG